MSSSSELLDKVVDLVNRAKLEAKEQKIHLLTQVKELCLKRDTSLLPEVVPMVAEFQTDFNANCRKFVATFLRDVVRAHPEHVGLVVPVASYLMHDVNTHVKKMAVLLANTVYRPALQRLVDNGSIKGAQQDWSALEGLRKVVLNTITSGPADISMVAIKFAESVVLACVGGRGLGPGASRMGDKSVQRDLRPSHPFLLAETLDQAGHALARQMVGWLGSSGSDSGSGTSVTGTSTGWGSGFGAQHYAVLINALQSLATNRAALFSDIVPAFASALDNVNGGQANSGGSGHKNSSAGGVVAAGGAVPKGLNDTASSLRSACLKLLKVAPGTSNSVQRLAAAAALSGSDGEAKAAVDGNPALRGRIKLPVRPKARRISRPAAAPVLTLAFTAEDRRVFANLAASASLGKVPKPPPGYKHNRTEGFPLADLEMLFGHVLNAVGSDLATAKSQKPPPNDAEGESRGKQVGGPSVGNKRSREGAAAGGEGGGKRRSVDDAVRTAKNNGDDAPGGKGQSSMEVEDSLGGDNVATKKQSSGESVESKLELESESSGPAKEGLEAAKKAFCRVLGVWEGVATEGKRNLHQRVVARLGRMLVQTEAGAIAQRENTSQSEMVVTEVVNFMTRDYRKRFQGALALLTDIYVADVAAAAQPLRQGDEENIKGGVTRKKLRSFYLYDEMLVSLLSALSGSLDATWRQKLFTQTLLECPRVPPAALELVCNLCDMAAKPHDVQTGLVALRDLIFHKPATRGVCIPSVLRFTYHTDNEVRKNAVRLASNLLWRDPAFQPTVEEFAKQALTSVRRPNLDEENKMGGGAEGNKSGAGRAKKETQEQDFLDFEGEEEEEEKEDSKGQCVLPPVPVSVSTPPPGEVRMVVPWLSPPETEAAARVRLSLYFALCVKSRAMLSGLLEAYVTGAPAAQAGLMVELPLLAKAAAARFGEPTVVGLLAAAPDGAQPLVLLVLDLLVPRETNKPSPELVAAVRRLREMRVAKNAAMVTGESGTEEGKGAKVDEIKGVTGIEYMVPILGGLGPEGVTVELPALLQADGDTIRAAFRRLTQPTKGATYAPAELVVLLNQFDYTTTGVPIKRLTRALSLCLENKVPPVGSGGKQLPLLLMRTVMVSVTTFPELKNFVATVVLVRLVQQQVWTQPRIWDGFLRCAKMMAKESGATSFIAMVQLPDKKLKEALASPLMKGVREPLRRYAQTLVKVDPGVRAVLGMETSKREPPAKK